MGEPQWVKRFTQAGRVGTYLRVLEHGKAQAGDTIEVEHVPGHGITVGKFFSDPSVGDVRILQELHETGKLTLNAHYWKKFQRISQKDA